MPKKQYYLILSIAIIIIGALIFWAVSKPKKAEAPTSGIVFYYGQDCSHCKNVEKFIEDNKIVDKVKFSQKEVQYNLNNSREFLARVKECGINQNEAGVPFVYSEGKCFVGEPEVTDFFKNKAGI